MCHSDTQGVLTIGTELHKSKLPAKDQGILLDIERLKQQCLLLAYQNSCESADLCLTCIWSQVVSHHINSYCVRHGNLCSFVHLTKAALQPERAYKDWCFT